MLMFGNLTGTVTGVFIDTRCLLLLAVVCLLFWWTHRPTHLLPGPFALPLVGSFPTFAWQRYRASLDHHEFLTYLVTKYGKIYSVNTFGSQMIVISDLQLLKEAMNNPKINDRFAPGLRVKMFGINRVAYDDFHYYRRFLMSTFRHFGAGRQSFENKVAAESVIIRKEVAKLRGEGTDLHLLLNNATSNVICSVVYGQRYEYDDTEFQNLMNLNDRLAATLGAGGSENTLPIFSSLFPSKTKMVAIYTPIREYLARVIDDHRKNFDSEHINDFVDAYLREQELQSDSLSDVQSFVHEENMRGNLLILFMAAAHPTSIAINWGILYLLANQDVQSRLQSELDTVVGRSRFPSISDKVNMPYTRAVIQEIYRMASPLPISVLHMVSADTTIGPYNVPKGATVVPNIWGIHRDPTVWEDPDDFRPERFIERPDKVPLVIPFGVGRRSCPGEALAQAMMFIFFTHLLHQFKFVNPEGSQPSLKGELGLVYKPVDFMACALERQMETMDSHF